MTIDTAALEQLLKRFEALRGCGLIKLLVIEQTGAPKRDELPPSCQPFTSACDTITTCYGTAAGTGPRVYSFRWLGRPEAVQEVLSATQAAAQLLQVPLAQAGLIHPADFVPPRDSAHRCAWVVAMLTAAERGQLVCDAMPAEGWKHWSGEVAISTRTVDFYRSQVHLHQVDPVAVLAQAMDASSRFVVLANVAECCIGLLRVLASMKPAATQGPKAERPARPQPEKHTCELLEEMWSTGAGKERLIDAAARSQKAVGKLIGRSAAAVNGSPFFRDVMKTEVEQEKAVRALARDGRSRFGRDNADLGSV